MCEVYVIVYSSLFRPDVTSVFQEDEQIPKEKTKSNKDSKVNDMKKSFPSNVIFQTIASMFPKTGKVDELKEK